MARTINVLGNDSDPENAGADPYIGVQPRERHGQHRWWQRAVHTHHRLYRTGQFHLPGLRQCDASALFDRHGEHHRYADTAGEQLRRMAVNDVDSTNINQLLYIDAAGNDSDPEWRCA